jgi:hypothetical protein
MAYAKNTEYDHLPVCCLRWGAEKWNEFLNGEPTYHYTTDERQDMEDYYFDVFKPKLDKENEKFFQQEEENNKKKETDFIIIPNDIIKLKRKGGLNSEDLLTYGKIKGLCNKHGYCWATNKHLAEFLNVSTRSIQLSLKKLQKLKLISMKMNYKPGTFHVESRHITIIPIKKQKKGQDLPIPDYDLDQMPL